MAQKSCKRRENICGRAPPSLYRGPDRPPQWRFAALKPWREPWPSAQPTGGKDHMAARSWFYASEGQQQGPYPEIQLRELIARGTITADTLVWTEGMANWQRAGEIPGLAPGGSAPPVMPRSGAPLTSAGGYRDGPLSIDFEIWDFVWRSIVLLI